MLQYKHAWFQSSVTLRRAFMKCIPNTKSDISVIESFKTSSFIFSTSSPIITRKHGTERNLTVDSIGHNCSWPTENAPSLLHIYVGISTYIFNTICIHCIVIIYTRIYTYIYRKVSGFLLSRMRDSYKRVCRVFRRQSVRCPNN